MPLHSFLEQRVRERLARWKADGLIRSLHPPSGIDLSSNDYLGLSGHPLLRQQMTEAIAREGCGSTGSRLLRGDRDCFARLEQRFAEFKSTDRSLYFSSGYLANLAVLTTFTEAGDVIYSDERNHASLIDGIRLSRATRRVFPHNDSAKLSRLLQEESAPGQKFVVTESLYGMDGDRAPLADYAALCRLHRAALIVDEAHAVGIFGPRGSGLLEETGTEAFLSINTAGKALGVGGAFVAGEAWAIAYLVQRARSFVFSTAPPPALTSALDAALEVIEREPWRRTQLRSRARYLRIRMAEAGIKVSLADSQIVPVVLGENERALQVARALQQSGFDARAIRPPTVPPGTARLRLSVHVGLSEETINRFVAALASALEESVPCPEVYS